MKFTGPLPVPEAVTVIHELLLTVFQVQVELEAFTVTEPDPPLLPIEADEAVKVKLQVTGAAV